MIDQEDKINYYDQLTDNSIEYARTIVEIFDELVRKEAENIHE
jgi:hypothetical protein